MDINTLVINILSCEGAEGSLESYEQSWIFVKSVEVQIISCIPVKAELILILARYLGDAKLNVYFQIFIFI